MTSATFRHPGVLAISVAGGPDERRPRRARPGARRLEAEHRAYGIPLPGTRERFERLEETLEVVTGLWRTPALAARLADQFNIPFESVELTRTQLGRVREACAEVGRDPETLVHSNALVLCCGHDETEVRRRADAIGRDVAELRQHGLAGTPAEVVDTLGRYAEAGASRVYLQVLDLADLEHLALVASQVVPQL